MRFNLAKYLGLLTITIVLRIVFGGNFTFIQWFFIMVGLNLISFETKSKNKED